MIVKLIPVALLFVAYMDATAQHFLGLSVNYGDRLTFNSSYPGLLLRRRSFSPTLVYSNQKKINSDFAVIYGGQIGIAGYQLTPVVRDTVGFADTFTFADYGIFVSRLEITPGKLFYVRKRELFVGVGGGVSYYHVFPFTTMDIIIDHQGMGVNEFSAVVEAPSSGTFCGFVKIYLKMPLSGRFDLSLQYASHWKSILEGEFEFHHTTTIAAGSIRFVPRGLSVMLLYHLKTGLK
jgi:hypothetical protein